MAPVEQEILRGAVFPQVKIDLGVLVCLFILK